MEDDRLRLLLDIEEIRQLKARYFRYIDTKDWGVCREVFTADARIDIGGVRTVDEFISVTRAWLGDAVSVHSGSMPEIDITGPGEATGIWGMRDYIVFPDEGGAPRGMRGYGHYHDRYRRIDGRWRIHTTRLTRLRIDPFEGGLPDV
ncbi:nuclear transport factor 2 family protein [Microbispora sp. RL4-1S]|uniref:Nuclear transport factor 2 family protein n=1 Tax=Microbispora oryzae TaxID=2806554 RepID=A0A940WNM5_9ACTN|nr:nuclear transport factor 2 family protein [Microbispora oryzae]MBP2706368.1 nuclear transport factor 2 family protein [Microbispora oryzae]